MATHNEYSGYVKLPNQELCYDARVRLDFGGSIDAKPGHAKHEGFTLRLFVPKHEGYEGDQPEISVTMRPEEWLDLIDSMKEEFERIEAFRKKLEG